MTSEVFVIGQPEQKPGSRHEACDACLREVWLPRGGQDLLDEAEDAHRRSLVSCITCARKRLGTAMAVGILVHQNEEWK